MRVKKITGCQPELNDIPDGFKVIAFCQLDGAEEENSSQAFFAFIAPEEEQLLPGEEIVNVCYFENTRLFSSGTISGKRNKDGGYDFSVRGNRFHFQPANSRRDQPTGYLNGKPLEVFSLRLF